MSANSGWTRTGTDVPTSCDSIAGAGSFARCADSKRGFDQKRRAERRAFFVSLLVLELHHPDITLSGAEGEKNILGIGPEVEAVDLPKWIAEVI